MALITCPECKNQISEHADSCPQCGYKFGPLAAKIIKYKEKQLNRSATGGVNAPPPKNTLKIVFFVIVGLTIIGALTEKPKKDTTSSNSSATETKAPEPVPAPEPVKVKSTEELREDRIKVGFSPWDGSHRQLEELVKKSMNDPDSYKHDVTKYVDKGKYLLVMTRFRGKNAFGAMMPNTVTAKCDLDGNVLEVLSQDAE